LSVAPARGGQSVFSIYRPAHEMRLCTSYSAPELIRLFKKNVGRKEGDECHRDASPERPRLILIELKNILERRFWKGREEGAKVMPHGAISCVKEYALQPDSDRRNDR